MRVYYFENIRYAQSGWNYLFKDLVYHLISNHNAEVIHRGNHRCPGGTAFYVKEFDYHMADCEIMIYDEVNDSLKAISYSERYTNIWNVFLKRNNKNDVLIVPQFYDWFNKDLYTGEDKIDLSQYNFKLGSSVFYTIDKDIDYEGLYKRRKELDQSEIIDKMFMLFTTQRPDPYELSKRGYLNESMTPVSPIEYFNTAIQYKVGLAIATLAEYCYREIEYMAIGLPFIRIEYMRDLDPPLIPNYHYIAIDRKKYDFPYNSQLDREGGEKYIQAYIDRFTEVKDDKDFLDFISNNAREYYLNYCAPKNRLNHMLNLLNIDPELKLVY